MVVSLAGRVTEADQRVHRHQPVMDARLEVDELREEPVGQCAVVEDESGVALGLEPEVFAPHQPGDLERLVRVGPKLRIGKEVESTAQRHVPGTAIRVQVPQ